MKITAPTVFIGGPLTALLDPDSNLIEGPARQRYEELIAAFEADGWEVLNAHRFEDWGAALAVDADCTERDFKWMRDCDVFVAFPGHPASPGTHVEIGWASALGVPTVLLLEPGAPYASLVTGLPVLSPVTLMAFDGNEGAVNELVNLVRNSLTSSASAVAAG